jgi:hypothetical protein
MALVHGADKKRRDTGGILSIFAEIMRQSAAFAVARHLISVPLGQFGLSCGLSAF